MFNEANDKFPVWLTEMQIKTINMCIDASLKIVKQAGMTDEKILSAEESFSLQEGLYF